MSFETAKRFLAQIEQHPNLQTYLESSAWDARLAARIALTFGFRFNAADLHAAIDATWGVLSEEELTGVTGGGGNGRGGSGAVTVTTGTTGTDASGGSHSPPPGDVSGNSCFFSRSNRR